LIETTMALKCDEYHGVCVLAIDGDFTGDTTASLRRCAEERFAQKPSADFVVDMEKTASMDSDALETLLWLKERCDDGAGRVKLANPSELTRMVLEITRLDHRFECSADVGSALKALR
jgi:anti-anti-sigma factor